MVKRYISIIAVYIICQISGFLAYTPLLSFIPIQQRPGFMVFVSFLICLIVTLLLLLPERHFPKPKMATKDIVNWCIAGIFLVYLTQIVAGIIDYNLFGAPPGSQNTQDIMKLVQESPYIVLVVIVMGPMIEEIIFRKIIFGSLNRWFNHLSSALNYWLAGLISALLFALAHGDGHLIIYGSIGLMLAFLYHKTGRIYVSMIAHGSMNTIATVLALSPQIQHLIEKSQTGMIGWWF